MADKGKKREKEKCKSFEYLENKKNFFGLLNSNTRNIYFSVSKFILI